MQNSSFSARSLLFAAALGGCIFFMLPACNPKQKDTDNNTFNLQAAAQYGNQSFALNAANTDSLGRRLKLEKLKFYLSDVTLVKNDNTEVPAVQIALLDFGNPSSLQLQVENIEGDFKAIKFGVGVDSAMNATDPLSVPASDPLGANQNMYWAWLKYIFASVEGKYDTTTAGNPVYNHAVSYHTGGNNLYRQVVLNKSFSICCGNNKTVTLKLDVEKLFYGISTIDMVAEPVTNTDDFPAIALKVADNFSTAFTLE